MKYRTSTLALGLLVAANLFSPVHADERPAPIHAAATRLEGLDQAAAQALTARLESAQAALRRDDGVFFALLSGAPASYKEARLSPRDAFLSLSFAHPFSIATLAPDGTRRKFYRLALLPNGPGNIVCEVDVVLGVNGQIERVQLFYQPPAPF